MNQEDQFIPHLIVSDGLAADVHHLCEESRCGAVLHAETIPITAAARGMSDDRSPLEHALGDGEDFELALAVSAEEGRSLVETQPVPGMTLTHIGECVENGYWLEENGQRHPLEPHGYVHEMY